MDEARRVAVQELDGSGSPHSYMEPLGPGKAGTNLRNKQTGQRMGRYGRLISQEPPPFNKEEREQKCYLSMQVVFQGTIGQKNIDKAEAPLLSTVTSKLDNVGVAEPGVRGEHIKKQ